MIFIIDSDEIVRKCVALSVTDDEVLAFGDAIEAIKAIGEGKIPTLILMDVVLTGPNGFTFLNELISYSDTAKIPVVIMSSINLNEAQLNTYGVVGILNKETMTPDDVRRYVDEYTR